MRHRIAFAIATSIAAISAKGAIVALTAGDINGTDTNTTSFSNADVTITPYAGGVAASFNGITARLGVDNAGTSNINAFTDPDQIAGNANDETLQLAFQPTVGLTQLSWDYARADGPLATDGIRISGFLADPSANLTGPGASGLTYNAGTLSFQLSGAAFADTDGVLTLNGGASAGQTLTIFVNDSTQAGAQLPITGLSYDNDVTPIPEPSSALLGALAGLGLLRRRR